MKHTNVKYHYTKRLVKDKIINVKYCPTNKNLADLFTKPLNNIKTTTLCDRVLGCLPTAAAVAATAG